MTHTEERLDRAKEVDLLLDQAAELIEVASHSKRRSAAVLVSVLMNADKLIGTDDYYIAKKLGLTPSFNSEIKKAKAMYALMLDLNLELVKK
jgi:hypothetical protein